MSTTTTRLLTVLSLLQARRDWPGPLLAERLGVSGRTVRRDVERLREMGYNIQAHLGPDGGYRLYAGSQLPPLLFDDEQAVAITVALHTASLAGAGIEEAATRALATMGQVLPSRLRHRLDALQITAIAQRPGPAPTIGSAPDALLWLAHAIRAREVLRFDYAPRSGVGNDNAPGQIRRVEPHHIVSAHGRWYLLAWDLERHDWRLFGLDRITPRATTGPRFTPREVPGGDVADFVAARFKGSDVNQWPCRGSVILELPAAEVVPFMGDGAVTPIDEGTCILEAGAWSWGALAASFGRFETAMTVVGPPQLRQAFAVVADRYAAVAHAAQHQAPSALTSGQSRESRR
ncbi:MAG: helix-turn-helix transcriptional regulator [Arachnia sp.]